jgi:lipopolysaccharide transport system permease protein
MQTLELIKYKVYSDLRVEAERTYLGVVWWVIEPLIFMGLYYLVFGVLLQRGGEDFVMHLIIGVVCYQWFASTVNGGQRAILSNKQLLRQAPLNKVIFPYIYILTSLFKFMVGLVLLFGFLAFYRFTPQVTWLLFPVLLAIEFLLISGVTLILAAIVPLFPDLANLTSHATRLLMYLSGIFYYASDIISPEHLNLFYMNPMALLISSNRAVLMAGEWPEYPFRLAATAVVSIVMCVFGIWLTARWDGIYAKRIYK